MINTLFYCFFVAVMKQFNHPHIIRLFGVVTQGFTTYIVMELAPLGQVGLVVIIVVIIVVIVIVGVIIIVIIIVVVVIIIVVIIVVVIIVVVIVIIIVIIIVHYLCN